MGVTLELPWHVEANRVHRACHSYARATRETDPAELCRWVIQCVPGGRREAWWDLVNDGWVRRPNGQPIPGSISLDLFFPCDIGKGTHVRLPPLPRVEGFASDLRVSSV